MSEAIAVLLGMEMYIANELSFSAPVDYTVKGIIFLVVGYFCFKLARHVWKVERGIVNLSET